MLDLLRKSCPHCTVSSIKTYAQNVKGLAKVAGLKAVPTNAKWLTGKLLETIKNKPLNQYKRLAITGVKALGAYGKKDRKWHDAMNDATTRYAKKRDTQQRTDREERNWPKDGYRALKTLASTLHRITSRSRRRQESAPATCTSTRDTLSFCSMHTTPCAATWAMSGSRARGRTTSTEEASPGPCTSANTRPSSQSGRST